MLNFIVLGQIPGTHAQISFYQMLVAVILSATLTIYILLSARKVRRFLSKLFTITLLANKITHRTFAARA